MHVAGTGRVFAVVIQHILIQKCHLQAMVRFLLPSALILHVLLFPCFTSGPNFLWKNEIKPTRSLKEKASFEKGQTGHHVTLCCLALLSLLKRKQCGSNSFSNLFQPGSGLLSHGMFAPLAWPHEQHKGSIFS